MIGFIEQLINITTYSGLTLFCYFAAKFIHLRSGNKAWLHPMLIASAGLIFTIAILKTPIATYQDATSILTWMIGPLSIGLMVPLAENIGTIRRFAPAIVVTLIIGSCFTVISTLGIAILLGVSKASLLALSTKSVTTPVALAIGKEIGALPSLTSLIVIVTGVMGVITAPIIFTVFNIKDKKAQGLTLGLSAHIIGTAYAAEQANDELVSKVKINHSEQEHDFVQNNEYVAFSIVSMSLVALMSAFVLPWLVSEFS